MKTVELYARVRHAVQIEGISRRAAAERFGINARTVSKMLKFSVPPGYVRRKPPFRPKLAEFIAIIDAILAADKDRPKKQRHTSKRIFERLRDEHGFTGRITIVKDYVAGWRQQPIEQCRADGDIATCNNGIDLGLPDSQRRRHAFVHGDPQRRQHHPAADRLLWCADGTGDERHRTVDLNIRPGTSAEKRERIVEAWYRDQLKAAVPGLIAKWQRRLDVKVDRFFVQRMKTKWGSCSPTRGSIRLNTELAKKPPQCLEYVIVHELAHLVERHHNERFVKLLDRHIPQWRTIRDELNSAPLSHEHWG